MNTKPLSIFDNSKKHNRRKMRIFCGNCGGNDHTYRDCLHPVTSLGVILFENRTNIRFLMVRRKDTIGYVEFIRGKYALNDLNYICKMIDSMTIKEKTQLLERNFELLWRNLWMENYTRSSNRTYKNNYNEAKIKFLKLKSGIKINEKNVNLESLIKNSKTQWVETEWGMPKGRRNNRESDKAAAIREFTEETGIFESEFILLEGVKPFIEEYIGSDNVVYRHIYYLAKYIGKRNLTINPCNKSQITEISKLSFYTLEEAHKKIRDYYEEKKRVLSDVSQFLIDNKLLDNKNIYQLNMNVKNFKSFDKKYSKSI